AGGRPVVHDLFHDTTRVVGGESLRGTSRLAFAPSGDALAIAATRRLSVLRPGQDAGVLVLAPGSTAGVGWVDGRPAWAPHGARRGIDLYAMRPGGKLVAARSLSVPGRIAALDANDGRLVAATQRTGSRTRVLAAVPDALLPLLELPAGTAVEALAVR